ncbi:hypothetical protein RHMOL_Rhmol08G0184100 [Rhododendron molle]|uniref:Uncharacterized protein n=1 Tax=Rhododendron molle TaxID=49168 RepID=A0ACC0MR15_RHOML|nr:hypothetical protein RHMOL_Rhmol08G0184100 [Rhododendron molle]
MEQQQETAGDEVPRAAESETRARDQIGAVGVSGEPEVSGMVAEGLPVVGGSSGGIIGSGAGEDDTGPSQTPPRDSAKGKGAVIAEEQVEEAQPEREQTIEADPVEVREEDIAFRPPAGAATSSRHVPITFDEIAEHTPDAILARLLEERPDIGEYVLKAKEDRARAVEAAARAEREAEGERAGSEGLAADVEAEEAEAEEALGPRVSAVAEAGALERPEFSEEAYTPPRPHLFVPLGFAGYRPPQQTDYDPELILRDAGVHIANTWAEAEQRDIRGFGGPCSSLALYIGLPARVDVVDHQGNTAEVELVPALREPAAVTVQVPAEWVNEALRRMLALENLVRRAAQGMPLQLRYPAPAAQPAQAAAASQGLRHRDGRLLGRERGRLRSRQRPRPVVTRRQTRSSQPTAASKEAAKKAVARAEERYRIEMREVRGREEPVRKRLVGPDPVEDEEEGDEKSKSDSDDTVDDPRYLQNPHELAAADEDDSDDHNGGDDVEEDLRDTDWLGRDEDD